MRKQKASRPTLQEANEQRRERNRNHAQKSTQHAARDQRRPEGRQPKRGSLGAGLAVIAGRTAGALSRRLRLGGGTSVAGAVAQRVYPDIVHHLATQLEYGSVVVTGTNGKTTTSSFIAAILRDAGLRVWRNREGANLMRGVASSLVIRALPNGQLRRSGHAISILEVDEAILPQVVPVVQPRIAIFTNLFRDQLDRYGEVDSVMTYWQRAISSLPPTTTLVLNADDPAVAHLGSDYSGKVLYYGIDDPALNILNQPIDDQRYQVLDTRICPECGKEYLYSLRFYSHMGHYFCPECGLIRPQPQVRATLVQSDSFDRLRVRVDVENQQHEIVVPLPGLYNIYNALAAITTAMALEINWEPITSGIEQFKPVFGRGESIQVEGRTIRLLLAKNPTGFNEVLRTLFSSQENIPKHLLFVLNDNTADGRDISWIWDVDFERVMKNTSTLVVAGTRARDLALRLKYAGVDQQKMAIFPSTALRASSREALVNKRKNRNKPARSSPQTPDASQHFGLKNAISTALQQTPPGETLFIVPTYTGLLEVHRELEQRGLAPRYWEGRDA